jgi:hypothetical protein
MEWPNSEYEEDEAIVAPLRQICQKSSVSEDEITIAIDRAQATLLKEFAQVWAAIRSHYPEGYPRFIALPSITTARALAAEYGPCPLARAQQSRRAGSLRGRATAVNATSSRSPVRPMFLRGGRMSRSSSDCRKRAAKRRRLAMPNFRKIAALFARRAQPVPPDADHPFLASAEFKTALATIIKDAFSDGKRAERKRIGEVLQAPGAASYPLLAFELAIDGASVAQVSAVIARTEVAVQARIHPTESSPLESSTPTLH